MSQKRLFGLFFAALVVSSMFVGIVSAQSFADVIIDPVAAMFTGFTEGQLSDNVAKYVFFILISLVIFAVLDNVPLFKDRTGLTYVIAFLVGFLSTAYLTPTDVHLLLTSYGALGLLIGAVLPFVILVFFSVEINKAGGAGGKVLTRIMWIAFIVFLIWKVVRGIYFPGTFGQEINVVEGWIYLAVIILAIIWVIRGEKWFLQYLFSEQLVELQEAGAKDLALDLTAQIADRKKRRLNFTGEPLDDYDAVTAGLEKKLKAMKKKYKV